MKLFGKKKDEELDDALDENAEHAPVQNASLSASIETINAKLEAVSELRKADSERFERISEQIGELRNLILEKEEEIKELGIKATKAAEMVGSLQPEKILSEIGKSSAKYEQADAKIEATKQLYEKIMEEIKGVRSKLALFQGAESLMDLNKDTSQNLAIIRKAESTIERQSNVVGNMFVQFQKQISDFTKEKEKATAVEEKMKEMLKEFDNLKIKAQSTLIGQDDLEELRQQVERRIREGPDSKRLQEMERKIASIEKAESGNLSQKSAAERLMADGLSELRQRILAQEQEISEVRKDFAEAKDRIYGQLLPAITGTQNAQAGNGSKIARESEMNERLEKLKHAISKGDLQGACQMYNSLRGLYLEISESLPRKKEKSFHDRMIEAYNNLSMLAQNRLTTSK